MPRFAVRNAPSKPYLTDSYEPTNPTLWEKVLMVARGDLREMTRVGPKGPRTIHAPNHGLGYRHWPNMRAVAWAVKQYNGYGGRWKSKETDESKGVTAAVEGASGWLGLRVPSSTSRILKKFDVPGTPEDEEYLHTTLIYMGETSLEAFCKAIKVAYRLAEETRPLHLKTRRITCFPKCDEGVPIICDIESEALHKFHKRMHAALDEAGVDFNKKFPVYKPHVCLSYAEEPIPDRKFPEIEWTVEGLDLWFGHNGDSVSVKVPFKNGFGTGDRVSSTRRSLQDTLSLFRTLWRFKTANYR